MLTHTCPDFSTYLFFFVSDQLSLGTYLALFTHTRGSENKNLLWVFRHTRCGSTRPAAPTAQASEWRPMTRQGRQYEPSNAHVDRIFTVQRLEIIAKHCLHRRETKIEKSKVNRQKEINKTQSFIVPDVSYSECGTGRRAGLIAGFVRSYLTMRTHVHCTPPPHECCSAPLLQLPR